jgi:RNA polymerase sigma factor (sigma-70 family)
MEELAAAYGPVAEYHARQYYMDDHDRWRSLDDLRQDAWEGIILAWGNYKAGLNCSFKVWAVSMARWQILKNVRHVDANLVNSWAHDRMAYNSLLRVDSLDRLAEDLGDHAALLGVIDEPACHRHPSMGELLALVADPRLRLVVEQYHAYERTLQDIGDDLGISRARVRQLLGQAYSMIRMALAGKARGVQRSRGRTSRRIGRNAAANLVAGIAKVTPRTAQAWFIKHGVDEVIRQVREAKGRHGNLLTVAEMAARTGMDGRVLYGLIESGGIDHLYICGAVRIPESVVDGLRL